MITREQASKQVLELSEKNDALFIEACTGFGKSKMAIDIQDGVRHQFGYNPRTLILIAGKAHKQNWIDEYRKHHMERLLATVEFYCYASLHKLKETEWDLIVCDEAHHLSPLRIYTLSTVKSEKIIFLSATLKRSIKASIEAVFKDKKFDIFTVSTQEAIDANILPEPKMFIHQLSLNSIDINQELVLRKGTRVMPIYCSWDNRWLMLKDEKFKDNSIICNCTEVQKYQWLCDQVNYWKKRFMNNSGAYYLKNKWMKAALDRKIFLGELKTGYVYKNIFSEIKKSERMICFCTSIDQANILGRHDSIGRYNSNSAIVHSKIKNVGKVIEVFQNKGINALFCVNMLREGMNLNEINTGVIVQLDGTELPFIQKLGRVLRADSPNVHIIYFKNTRDEEYLEKILNHIDSGYIKYIGV